MMHIPVKTARFQSLLLDYYSSPVKCLVKGMKWLCGPFTRHLTGDKMKIAALCAVSPEIHAVCSGMVVP